MQVAGLVRLELAQFVSNERKHLDLPKIQYHMLQWASALSVRAGMRRHRAEQRFDTIGENKFRF